MSIKKIKIFGKYFFNSNQKMSIDDNLFFDLSKVSFISEEMFFEEPLDNGRFSLSFYFTFILDGVLFEVKDNVFVTYFGNPENEIKKTYPSILVFKLRREMLNIVFN